MKRFKYKDFPKIYQSQTCVTSVPLSDFKRYLDNYCQDFPIVFEPPFHRGRAWNVADERNYIEYLLMGGTQSKEIVFNYPSWNARVPNGEYNEFTLVDGLQRLNAIIKFINSDLTVFQDDEKFWIDGKDYNGVRFEDIEARSLRDIIISFRFGDIKSEKEVVLEYLRINSYHGAHTKEDKSKACVFLEK